MTEYFDLAVSQVNGAEMAFCRFITANDSTLSFTGGYVTNGDSGETVYTRGEKEPSF